DHFLRILYTKPSPTKTAKEATTCLLNFCMMYSFPIVLYSDNTSEFVGRVIKETLNLWLTIKFVNSRPRNTYC
ncbi:28702_t:CDS:1, partial [Dentiscutata erythropus]